MEPLKSLRFSGAFFMIIFLQTQFFQGVQRGTEKVVLVAPVF